MKFNFEMESQEMESIMTAIISAVKTYADYEKENDKLRFQEEKDKRQQEINNGELREARNYLKEVITKTTK